jgi:hypothetical protein
MPSADTRFKATQEVLALVTRVIDGIAPLVKPNGVDANGVLINPRMKLVALKAAREHIDQAIARIERKWPATSWPASIHTERSLNADRER